jgi:hypothetical protein
MLQKSTIRIISLSAYNAHTEPLFKKLSILPFVHLTEFFRIQFMQRYINDFLPISFRNMWTSLEDRRQEFTLVLRNGNTLDIPFARLTSTTLQPYVKLPSSWINFSCEEIKIIRAKPEFNSKLKKFFLDKLSSDITCNRLVCHVCISNNVRRN